MNQMVPVEATKKEHILFNKTTVIIIVFFAISLIVGYKLFSDGMQTFQYYAEQQKKISLVEKVSMAENSIKSELEKYRKGEITKDSAIESIRQIVKRMIYKDEYGYNYVFLNKMDGVVLARPFRLNDELKNLIDQKDSKGNKIMRMVINDVMKNPDGAFTTYLFPNPATKMEDEKLSFSKLIPELDLFIGTGSYTSSATKGQFALVHEWMWLAFGLVAILTLPILIALYSIRSKNKSLANEMAANIEITEELAKQEESLRITLLSIGDGVIATDPLGRVTRMNQVAEKLTGWKYFDAVGKYLEEVFNIYNAETGLAIPNPVSTVIRTGRVVGLANHTVLVSKKGLRHHISDSGAPIKNENNEIEGVVLVFRDITEEYQLREETRQKDELFRTVVEVSPFSIAITDKNDFTYQFVNSSFERLSGFNKSEVIGKKGVELGLFDNEQYAYITKTIMETGKIDSFALEAFRKNKENISVLYSARIIKYEGKDCILSMTADMTETRRLYEQLTQAQKMDAVGQLAGGIAHDFNNMLGGILGAAEIIQLYGSDLDKQKYYLNMIIESTKRAGDLTKKLLSFSRKNKFESVAFDSRKSLEGAVDILQRSLDKKVKLEIDLSAENHNINGDITQLMNVFLNLGINSAHAMPEGGLLKFTSRNVILDANFCRNSAFKLTPGTYILYEVYDTGVGIPAEILSKIFDPFFTTKGQDKGTGLGLAVAYSTIVQHHGAITLYSEVGKGTMFHIYLPVIVDQVEEEIVTNDVVITGSGTILVIDDEEVIRLTAKAILEHLGYEVILAEDGRDGIEKFVSNRSKIDLVMLDMIMPEMNGRDCFKEIKKIDPNTKIIVSSGFSRENDLAELRDQGLLAFIRKPFHTSELSKVVSDVLSSKNA